MAEGRVHYVMFTYQVDLDAVLSGQVAALYPRCHGGACPRPLYLQGATMVRNKNVANR